MNKLRFKDVHLDQDEETYGFSTLEKFINRNRNRSRKKPIKKIEVKRKDKNRNKGGRKVSNRYAIIDPDNYEIVRFFDGITQVENYTGLKALATRLHHYEKYNVSSRASPFINGYIVVRWKDKEVLGLDRDDFLKFLHSRAIGWIVISQFDRIRQNIQSIDKESLSKLFNYLKKVEHINSRKLLEDEEMER